jgi:hypothetical protein
MLVWAIICGAFILLFNAARDLVVHYQNVLKREDIVILFASLVFWLFVFASSRERRL